MEGPASAASVVVASQQETRAERRQREGVTPPTLSLEELERAVERRRANAAWCEAYRAKPRVRVRTVIIRFADGGYEARSFILKDGDDEYADLGLGIYLIEHDEVRDIVMTGRRYDPTAAA